MKIIIVVYGNDNCVFQLCFKIKYNIPICACYVFHDRAHKTIHSLF